VAVEAHPHKKPFAESATMYIESQTQKSQSAFSEVLCKSPLELLKYCPKFFCAAIFSR